MRKRVISAFVAVLVFIIFNGSIFAGEKTLTVITFPLPGLIISETEGVFVLLTRELERRTGLKFEIKLKPIKRTVHEFKQEKGGMMFPVLEGVYDGNDGIILSEEVFYVKKDYIFTLKNKQVIHSVKELKDKKVGIVRGYMTDNEEMSAKNRKFVLEEVAQYEQNAKKLKVGRIDAVLAEEIVMLRAFQSTDTMKDIHYDRNAPISAANVYYAFHNTVKGRALEKKISGALKEIKADGTYEKIMDNEKYDK